MIALAFIAGAVAAGPISFLIGWFARSDRRITHEKADITSLLRRSL